MKTTLWILAWLTCIPGSLSAASNGWYREVVWCRVAPGTEKSLQAWSLSRGWDESYSMEQLLERSVQSIPAPVTPCEEGPFVYRWDESEQGLAALLSQAETRIRVLVRFADRPGVPQVTRKTVYWKDRWVDDVRFYWKGDTLTHTISDRYGIAFNTPPQGRFETWTRWIQTAFYQARHFLLGLFRG